VDEYVVLQAQDLSQEIVPSTQATISRFHDLAERTLAKKLKKDINSAVDDDAPLESAQDIKDLPSDDEEDEDEQDDDEVDEAAATERLRATILAEQRLCELTGKIVLAIIGRVLDTSGSQRGKFKQKLLKNKSRLGNNYKEVVAFLEDRKERPATARSKDKQPTSKPLAKSTELVELEDDPIEDDEPQEAEQEAGPIVEEDEEEDLRARGLVEENIDDRNSDQENGVSEAEPEDEDEIMGD
jgi:cohesin complex subunit SA-1/2